MKQVSIIVVGALIAALAIVGCDAQNAGAESDNADTVAAVADTAGAAMLTVNVETMEVMPEKFEDVINVIGTVKPAEDIMVAAEEGGKVNGWLVQKGAFVKKGQTIIKLNDDLLRSQLVAAEAQYNIAKVNSERSQKVYADAGAVSEVSVTTAQYNVDAAKANVDLLKIRIEKTSIQAPVSGRIDMRAVDVGEMVAPGAPIARLIHIATVKVTAGVPERFVEGMRVGIPVEMTFDALGGKKVVGKITYVGAAINEKDRTIPIEVELPNGNGMYTTEMIANMQITRNTIPNAIVVPRTAIVRVEDGYQVYLVVPGGNGFIAEARQVTLGPANQGKVVIVEGLKPGDRVVTVGQGKVNPGEQVTF